MLAARSPRRISPIRPPPSIVNCGPTSELKVGRPSMTFPAPVGTNCEALAHSRLDRYVLGGLGLAQQDEVINSVRSAKGILDFHRDATRQESGLALAADA